MRDIQSIRHEPGSILGIGNYVPAFQAILDFDYLCGKNEPSLVGIITAGSRFKKLFWGNGERLIPCFSSFEEAATSLGNIDWMLNVTSGRRAAVSTDQFFGAFPDALGGHIFAEDIPEIDAIRLHEEYGENKTMIGPAGVGLLVPGALKLGVVGGVDWRQLQKSNLMTTGSVAVLSASGGMINEIITNVAAGGHTISFALCFGGDRFPITTPRDAFLAAEADEKTTHIVYYGELGGTDEYELSELIRSGTVTKPVICYIAGVIGENFDAPVQFGHAKALANNRSETASAKREELRTAGAAVAGSMTEFIRLVNQIPNKAESSPDQLSLSSNRRSSRFSSTISQESNDGYEFIGSTLQTWASEGDIALQITSAILGHRPTSPLTTEFLRTVFLLSIDHGPQVSGALNTIITARAGKGIVDSVAAGLLTVGPRFGGAVSDAAREWLTGVTDKFQPAEHVESYARAKKYIGGIGHKKYRLGLPDPRTALLATYANQLNTHRYYDYAKQVEAITTAKKGNLILNVDGHIAALMLDILENEEHYGATQLKLLVDADFFNALFVIPRTIGFAAHYLDQKRLDEGLFRLPDEDVLLS